MSPSTSPITRYPTIDLDGPTVTTYLAEHPSISPHKAAARLFPKPFFLKRIWLRIAIKDNLYHRTEPTPEQIETAFRSGRWSTDPSRPNRPGDLFLKMYADVLLCLERNQLSGLVSPPLIGSCGVMPLTILSVIPDIMQHYYDCIVLAKREVLLATNYLQKSDSQRTICAALKELSHRVGERNQAEKVVVKRQYFLSALGWALDQGETIPTFSLIFWLMGYLFKVIYDRGNWKQVFKNHQSVKPNTSAWDEVGLPSLDDIPNLQLEVINFHRVILGTFHAKFLVVDRTVALLNSNNIQDRPNVEMMIHLEGPIVDSFYDMFLISWNNAFKVPLPFLTSSANSIASNQPTSQSSSREYRFASDNPFLRAVDVVKSAQDARATLNREAETDRITSASQQQDSGGLGFAAVVRDLMDERKRSRQNPPEPTARGGEDSHSPVASASSRWTSAVHQLIEDRRKAKGVGTATAGELQSTATHHNLAPEMTEVTSFTNRRSMPTEDALASTSIKPPSGSPTTTVVESGCSDSAHLPTASQVSLDVRPPRVAKVSINAEPSNPRNSQVHHERGASNDTAVTRVTQSSQPRQRSKGLKQVQSRMRALSDALNAGTLRRAQANVSEDHPISDFQPHTIHSAHREFPIVMVNRPPHGLPGHNDIRVPQNAAWIAGFKYAKKKVFIQTPTLNSSPVVRMCIDTAERGVLVILYLDLGFNDKGESIPFQGGTNQEVVIKMYKLLRKCNKQKYLKVYWYTGKDQIRPINAVLKSRNCHVKFMAIDDEVGIQGNGNQDTQSWFHSQEINVMIDSKQVVGEWMHALISNQNTQLYGKVGPDGIWRDEAGHTVDYYDNPKMAKQKKPSIVSEKKAEATGLTTHDTTATTVDAIESEPFLNATAHATDNQVAENGTLPDSVKHQE